MIEQLPVVEPPAVQHRAVEDLLLTILLSTVESLPFFFAKSSTNNTNLELVTFAVVKLYGNTMLPTCCYVLCKNADLKWAINKYNHLVDQFPLPASEF